MQNQSVTINKSQEILIKQQINISFPLKMMSFETSKIWSWQHCNISNHIMLTFEPLWQNIIGLQTTSKYVFSNHTVQVYLVADFTQKLRNKTTALENVFSHFIAPQMRRKGINLPTGQIKVITLDVGKQKLIYSFSHW